METEPKREQILGHGATSRCCEDQLPSAASGPRQPPPGRPKRSGSCRGADAGGPLTVSPPPTVSTQAEKSLSISKTDQ